jgi:predicted ATP-grasp superfamily ATP-dependent carboligase
LRVFVCEFVTGGGLVGAPLPAGLACEGDMMLAALVKDLADLPGIDPTTTRDARLFDPGLPGTVVTIDGASDPWTVWRRQIEETDATWPIAPETGGILERLSTLVLDCGRALLASRPAGVRVAASKRQTTTLLAARGIPTVVTVKLAEALASALPVSRGGWVVKPDDGAGAEDTFWLRTEGELRGWAEPRTDVERFVVQPFVKGPAASLSLLCGNGRATLLTCNSQDVRVEGNRFRYHGGVVGAGETRRVVHQPLAARIAEAVPDLWGYVGVDLIETDEGPIVLEINPRLTTSYVGLRRALGANPAGLVVQLLDRDVAAIRIPHPIAERVVSVASHAA